MTSGSIPFHDSPIWVSCGFPLSFDQRTKTDSSYTPTGLPVRQCCILLQATLGQTLVLLQTLQYIHFVPVEVGSLAGISELSEYESTYFNFV
jgi:hypothetical protein